MTSATAYQIFPKDLAASAEPGSEYSYRGRRAVTPKPAGVIFPRKHLSLKLGLSTIFT
jgi:hypothetical protein